MAVRREQEEAFHIRHDADAGTWKQPGSGFAVIGMVLPTFRACSLEQPCNRAAAN